MGQLLVKNYLHIVFSAKNRQPLIQPPYEGELYSYLGGICKNLECQLIKTGGYSDHVHILCMLSKKIAIMKLLEEVKSNSSKWVKTLDPSLQNFYWQDGYGAFSVNPSEVKTVTQYIDNQHIHHSRKTYQDELRAFLKKYEVEFMCGIKHQPLFQTFNPRDLPIPNSKFRIPKSSHALVSFPL